MCWRYDLAPDWRKPPKHPLPNPDWQLQELHRVMDCDGEYVVRVTRPDEQFSYNPRTKKGKELLERLNGGKS